MSWDATLGQLITPDLELKGCSISTDPYYGKFTSVGYMALDNHLLAELFCDHYEQDFDYEN